MASTSKKDSLVQKEAKKAARLVKEDAQSLASLSSAAAKSGAYLYPLQGIYYLLRHPKLLNSVKPLLYKTAVSSAAVLAAAVFLTYLPIVAALAIVTGPLAFIAAIPVVLGEAYIVANFIARVFYLPQASITVFDAVLAQRGHTSLVEKGRSVRITGSGATVLGKSILRPISSRFSTEGMIRYLISLPLNAIPGVGTALFLFYNGSHAGPSYHNRYFSLLSLSSAEQKQAIERQRAAYTAFGAVAIALGMIPVVGTAGTLASTVGAALWAADEEDKKKGGGAKSQESAKEVEFEDGQAAGREEL